MKSEFSFVSGKYENFIDEPATYIFITEVSVGTCLQTDRTSYPRNPYPSIFIFVWAISKSDDYDDLYTKAVIELWGHT